MLRKKYSDSQWLVIFCLIYIGLSSWLFFSIKETRYRFEVDSSSYSDQTENFEKYGSFYLPGTTECYNPYSIGYPIFMLFIRAVFGQNYTCVVIAQMLLILGMIFLIFKLAGYFFSRNVALLSAFFTAINLGFILYPQFILTETLLCFLILAGMERFVNYLVTGKLMSLIVSGLLIGCSIVVKAAALYFLVWLTVLLLIKIKSFKKVFLFAVAFSLPVGAYIIRNKNLYGYYYLKSIDRINLYHYYLPRILMDYKNITYQEAKKEISPYYHAKELASGEGWEDVNKFFIEQVKKHPFIALKVWFGNVFKTLLGLYTNHLKVLLYGDYYFGQCSFFKFTGSIWERACNYWTFGTDSKFLILLGIIESFWSVLRYIAVILGFIFLMIRKKYFSLIFFGSYIGYFALITGHDGCGRFRLNFEAPLIIISALGFILLSSLVFRKNMQILKSHYKMKYL